MKVMMSSQQKPFTIDLLKEISLVKAIGVILLISVAAVGFLIWLIYYKGGDDYTSTLITSLPALNALLNGTSAILLMFGYKAIRERNFARHMRFNLTAFVTSSLFLISYVIYHNFHGSTSFTGEGIVRPVYFFILITHIILSAVVMPLILTSFYLAFSGKLKWHRKVSKVTLPVWLYVSVTGVAIFVLLRSFS
jgi:putative membrane protein